MPATLDVLVPVMSAKKNDKPRDRVDLRIDPDLRAQAQELAKRRGLDLSSYLRLALTERMEKDQHALRPAQRRRSSSK